MERKAERILEIGAITLILGLLVWYLYEDFFCLNTFTSIQFKEDDLPFHYSLYNYQKNWTSLFDIRNDFGYGWIFWTIMSIIMYPFRYVYSISGNELLLCAMPRVVNLLFTVINGVVLYKILKYFDVERYLRWIGIALWAFSPAVAFGADKFGTNGWINAFTILSVYFMLVGDPHKRHDQRKRPYPRKRHYYFSLIFAAFAVGIKLTGLMVFPILVFLLWLKLQDRVLLKLVKIARFCLGAIILGIGLMCPQVVVPLINKNYSMNEILSGILNGVAVQKMYDVEHYFLDNLRYTWKGAIYTIPVLLLLLFGMLISYKYLDREKYKELCAFLVGFVICTLICSYIVTNGPYFNAMYVLQISFIPALGVIPLKKMAKNNIGKSIMLVFLVLYILNQIGYNYQSKTFFGSAITRVAYNERTYKDKVSQINSLRERIINEESNTVLVFEDWKLPTIVNSAMNEWGKLALYNNIDNFVGIPYYADYVIIDKESIEDDVVDNYVFLKRQSDKENADYWENVIREDVRLKKKFINNPVLDASFYEGIEIDPSYIMNTEFVLFDETDSYWCYKRVL